MRKGSKKPITILEVCERFNQKVIVTQTGCHEWQGTIQSNGYGRFNPFGKSMYAHRFAALLKFGFLQQNLDVCHTCDNRKCVNPDHLFIGSRQENMQDCQQKGRVAKGNKLSKKLNNNNILEIRALYQQGLSKVEIAEKFNVHKATIHKILIQETWRHV